MATEIKKEKRSLLFAGVTGAVLGLIFLTPFGLIWLVAAGLSIVLAELFLPQPVNLFLWIALCYLVTLMGIWYIFLNNDGLPGSFFARLDKRTERREK